MEALEPDELQRLVLAAVAPYIDRDILAREIAREEQQRRALRARRSPATAHRGNGQGGKVIAYEGATAPWIQLGQSVTPAAPGDMTGD
ncbi:hypothetical protein [Streptomyces sp. NPDC054987]